MKIIVFLSVALIAVLCSCLMSINEARVNIRQDILAVYVDNTKDFVNFTDDFRFPPGGSKKYSAEEAKEFYHSELPKLMERRLGVWESDEQDFSDFDEWRGAKKLCLKVLSAADVRLELVKPSGNHVTAPESSGGFMTDRSIFLGPEHNGLLFDYVMASNHIYSLFSPNGLQKRIRFVKSRELNSEECATATRNNPKVSNVPNFSYFESFIKKFPVPDDYFVSNAGLYCNETPLNECREYMDKEYIMINRHGDAFYFYKRKSDGRFAININGQPRNFDRYRFGGTRYYVCGAKIITTVSPSSPLEFYELQFSLFRNFYKHKDNQFDRMVEAYHRWHDERLIDWFEYPNSKRQRMFRKVKDIVFKEGDFVFTDDFHKLPQKEFVDMLNHGKKFSEVFGEKIYDPSLGAF